MYGIGNSGFWARVSSQGLSVAPPNSCFFHHCCPWIVRNVIPRLQIFSCRSAVHPKKIPQSEFGCWTMEFGSTWRPVSFLRRIISVGGLFWGWWYLFKIIHKWWHQLVDIEGSCHLVCFIWLNYVGKRHNNALFSMSTCILTTSLFRQYHAYRTLFRQYFKISIWVNVFQTEPQLVDILACLLITTFALECKKFTLKMFSFICVSPDLSLTFCYFVIPLLSPWPSATFW